MIHSPGSCSLSSGEGEGSYAESALQFSQVLSFESGKQFLVSLILVFQSIGYWKVWY